MLTPQQMKSFKKVNVCKDAGKVKARVAEDFKSTSNENKASIVKLSGLTRSSFYRVFDTGAITPKVALSLAQVLKVSPYYYIGAEDEKESYTKEILFRFLNEYGYGKLAEELKGTTKRQYNRKPKDIPAQEDSDKTGGDKTESAEPVVDSLSTDGDMGTVSISLNNSQKMIEAVNNLDEESAVLLLKALIKRAEGGGNAEILCGLVKHCLLS